MISYELRDASCELWVAILRKRVYELWVTFYELQFQKNKFTSCIAALRVEIKNLWFWKENFASWKFTLRVENVLITCLIFLGTRFFF